MKIEPVVSVGRPLITAYGAGGVRFGLPGGDVRFEGAVLILEDRPQLWDIGPLQSWCEADIAPISAFSGKVEFLLLGLGNKMMAPPSFLRASLKAAGLGLEFMTTAAACRAYNHLASEGRHFAAALLPVDAATP